MKLDPTLIEIFEQIKQDVQDKYKIEFSIEDLIHIVSIQFEATKLAFAKGISIKWIKFCKFIYTARDIRTTKTKQYLTTLDNNEDLTQDERIKLAKEKILESYAFKKDAIKRGSFHNKIEDRMTLEQVFEYKDINNVVFPLFYNLTNK